MNKRLYLGVLITLLTFILTSCGGTTAGPTTTPGNSSQPVTIRWWHIQTVDAQKANWQKLTDEYMKAHPNVKVEITVIENDAYKPKLATNMQSGDPPDLFHSWGGGVLFQYARAGLVKDITADLQGTWGDSFNKSALDVYGESSKYYGVPWDMGMVGFFYNKALFAKAGIEQPPTTWAEFLATVQTLKSAGITPIALGEKDKWPGHYWWVYLAVRLGGKDAFDKAYSRSGSFADPPFVQAGVHLKELVALEPFQTGFLGATYIDHMTQMGDGKAAMELMGQWAPNNDKDNAADGKGPELGFFPFPAVEGGAGKLTDAMGGGGGFAIGKNAPPETVDFLKFLTNAENQSNMAKEGFVLPTVKGTSDAVSNPLQKTVADTAGQATYFQLYYDQYLPPAMAQVILDSTQGLFAGTLTPEAAAQAVEDSAASSLR